MSKLHVLNITKGQDISAAIYDYLKDKEWSEALIINGIGSVSSVTIGNPTNYDFPPKVVQSKIDEPAEVLGFIGEIIKKDNAPIDIPTHAKENPSDYIVHIHITISHGNGIVTGGGFRNGTVMRALNIYIQEIY